MLRYDDALSVGTENGNLLIQGDNLVALKALLPYYAGRVKCIYIDPPYNTGNENWTYNDNVNSPEIRDWLGKVVGAEAEDLSRHDKWLCMLYPRLRLLRDFLTEDGAIFVSIDDNEVHNLRALLNEIFGPRNFVATIIWQKVYAPKSSARHFSEDHDYILVYARNGDVWRPNLLPRTAQQDEVYENPDNDPRGPWRPNNLAARNYYSKGTYSITCPGGRFIEGPPRGSYWRLSEERFWEMDAEGRIWWGKGGNNIPAPKIYLSEVKQGRVPQTLWTYQEVGHTQEAKQELVGTVDFADSQSVFVTPKPRRLMERIIQIATDDDSIILDSFAGSGTTGVAALSLNRRTGSRRRFVLVEMDETISTTIAAERLRRVIDGYTAKKPGGKEEQVEGLGGDFRYATLGPPLFDSIGRISAKVGYDDLARHVFYSETGTPLSQPPNGNRPLIGVADDRAVYLLGDDNGNSTVLTTSVLSALPSHAGPKVIYAAGCLLGESRLRREGITFRQIPYAIRSS